MYSGETGRFAGGEAGITTPRRSARARSAAIVAGLLTAEAIGYLLAWGAGRFGHLAPLALVGFVVVPALLVLMAADPRFGAAAVFLVFPIGAQKLGPIDIVQVLVMGVTGVVLVFHFGGRRLALPTPVWWLVGLLGWTLVSLPFALDPFLAGRAVVQLFLAVMWLVAVTVLCPRWGDVRRLLVPFVAVMAVVAAVSAMRSGTVQPLYGGAIVNGRAIGFTGDPNTWGAICTMTALVAIALALGGARGPWRWAAGAAAGCVMVGLLFSFSRGAWVGMVVGLAVLAVNLRQARRILLAIGLGVVPLAAVLGAFAPDAPQIGLVGERLASIVGQKSPYEYRPQIWAEARRQIAARPLVGEGPGNFPMASRRSTVQAESTFFADHAHNFLLTWGAEAGLPAVALLIGLTVHVTVLVRRARRRAAFQGRHRDVALLAGLTAALAALMTQGLVDYPLRHSVVFIALLTLLAFLLAGCRAEMTDTAPEPAPVRTGREV